MTTNLQKAAKKREKVSKNYETGTIFIIKLLAGFVFYVLLRILFSYILIHRFGMTRLWTRPVVEELTLIFSALFVGLSPWLKYHRINLVASSWIYALCFISFYLWFKYLLNLGDNNFVDAPLGILPVVVPYTLFIILYLIASKELSNKIMVSAVCMLLVFVWTIDLPRTYHHSKAIQTAVTNFEKWRDDFLKNHEASADFMISDDYIQAGAETRQLVPAAYAVSDSSIKMIKLDYVDEIYLQMNADSSVKKISEQAIKLDQTDKISYHYLYKYFTNRRIVFRDFEFDGMLLYRGVTAEGDTLFFDNISVRKRRK